MARSKWKKNLIELGRFGRKGGATAECFEDLTESMGIVRPEGSKAMILARRYLISEMLRAGLSVTRDGAGNLFGRLEGRSAQRAVLTGSHADTVTNGGQFDGIFGVVAALEAIRRMKEEGFENKRPIEMIVFMGEEGSCFDDALLGSSVLSGMIPMANARELTTPKGSTLGDLADAVDVERRDRTLADYEYFAETHIEQGLVLWAEKKAIGIPESIVGLCLLKIEFIGMENHAGTTPMHLRKNPLPAAADLISFSDRLAKERAKGDLSAVATVDTLEVFPNAASVIPERVSLTIDIRASEQEQIEFVRNAILSKASALAADYKVAVAYSILTEHKPCPLDSDVTAVIHGAAESCGYTPRGMFSGAVHDALNIAPKLKTGMIFVPSREGISHSPFEWTEWDDLEIGIMVHTETLKRLSVKD
jgi:hydantoinase/carbamoylase family amidase